MILTIRTDKPAAEVGLYDGEVQLGYDIWAAHRQLAETIHLRIKHLLESQRKNLHDIEGIVVFAGPGSFTGLRIGITIANALAMGIGVPVVGAQSEKWIPRGADKLRRGMNEHPVTPKYGGEVHITLQKK